MSESSFIYFSLSSTHHPKELVDVIPGVPDDTTEDDEDIVHVQLGHDGVGGRLVAGHGLAHQRDVAVVPSIVIHQCRPVGHARYLVAVIPPDR